MTKKKMILQVSQKWKDTEKLVPELIHFCYLKKVTEEVMGKKALFDRYFKWFWSFWNSYLLLEHETQHVLV